MYQHIHILCIVFCPFIHISSIISIYFCGPTSEASHRINDENQCFRLGLKNWKWQQHNINSLFVLFICFVSFFPALCFCFTCIYLWKLRFAQDIATQVDNVRMPNSHFQRGFRYSTSLFCTFFSCTPNESPLKHHRLKAI